MTIPARARRPEERQERAAATPRAAAPPIAMLARLQRSAGNRAVTAMLQRYDAYEHAIESDQVAGSQTVKVGTETLSSGEINALADLYGTPADLLKADPKEISALVALVRRQVAGRKVEEYEWDNASGGRYTKLNLKNAPHFSPRNAAMIAPPAGVAAGPDNLSMFKKFYTDTVTAIQQSQAETDAAKVQAEKDRSVVAAGFAEHYLMDAFSAGHLFHKEDFIAQLKANLDKLPAAQLTALFKSIAKGVLADAGSYALLDKYETVETHYGFHPNFSREEAFQGLLEELYKDADGRQAVYSGLVKVVHDELSTRTDPGGLAGVEVENTFETWVLSGDRTLDQSPDTQRIITRAIEEFRTIMDGFRTAPHSVADVTQDIGRVTDYFPAPTPASITMISKLVEKVTDATAAGTGTALIGILKAELPSILEALEKRGKIKKA